MNKTLSRAKKNVMARKARVVRKTRAELVRYVTGSIDNISGSCLPDLSSFSDSMEASDAADELEQLAMEASSLASDADRLAAIIREEQELLENKEAGSED